MPQKRRPAVRCGISRAASAEHDDDRDRARSETTAEQFQQVEVVAHDSRRELLVVLEVDGGSRI
jgi:hypothetical protein